MSDELDNDFTDELATSLRAAAAETPQTTDPYGPVGVAVSRDRRRRTAIGASLAVVAVLGAAIGIGDEVGRGSSASVQSSGVAPGSARTPTATPPPAAPTPSATPSTSTAKAGDPPTPQGSPSWSRPSTSQMMMLGWPSDFSLFPGYKTATTEAVPTVNAIVHTYGKPVGQGTRNVLDNLVGSFKLCGYSLSSYTFTLRWAGDLAHSGGNGAALVDVSHGGATYRMFGLDTYKGVWLMLPTTIDTTTAAHTDAAPLAELDQPAQEFYEPVVAAPGSKVTVSGTKTDGFGPPTPFQSDTVTVGASGVAEVELKTTGPQGGVMYPTITEVRIVRPDGTTATAPLLGGTSAAQEQSARELLPANTVCPGMTPEVPLKG